jgi:hypothetical protein
MKIDEIFSWFFFLVYITRAYIASMVIGYMAIFYPTGSKEQY